MKAEVLKKPKAFYDKFERKGKTHPETTHYCPGCGHGNVHKIVAEALEEFNLADRTILVSPVGCSVFAYYYFDVGNIQAAHGRAPAVATGLKRANPDSIVISYQGDGDLAAIGTAEIINAANRGENITVIFINNAIYGMTGGQMAPTTLVGQRTTTSPYGRSPLNEGYPIRMCELISTLGAPVYVERTALSDFKTISRARRAIRKAIKNQADNKGFSFIEVLSPCPTGWKLTPVEAQKWIQENMMTYYPVQVFKDVSDTVTPRTVEHKEYSDREVLELLGLLEEGEKKPAGKEFIAQFPEQKLKIAGFGGQGVLTAGVLLAACAMEQDLQVSWIPSYGPEMRGGTANCSVILSNKRIGSPLTSNPNVLIAMNGPSLDAFEESVEPGGLIIVNSSIIDRKLHRKDVRALYIPLTEMASNLGLTAAANMVCIGAYLEYTKIMDYRLVFDSIQKVIKKKKFLELNIKAVEAGVQYVREHYR
ncbi:MAG: 2-oxoacid:acceptor oxidoreductase family protein [candidate division KSB1 bacterium]|nr:2-oxoacid:acceptor oxidoreductase family protein [candidate division KSB1 bacterium]MDZ7318787.1 2-oxoacid:acceptor oxidoreductase family protein [candidate division KSB1 bacterium]